MKTIGVYKTDVNDITEARKIENVILRRLPGCDVSFDLEDCDKVLRVECTKSGIDEEQIKNILERHGYRIEQLPFEPELHNNLLV